MAIISLLSTGCKEPKPEPEPEPEVNILDKITDPVFLAYCQNAMVNEQELYFERDGYWSHPAWDTDGNGKLSPEEAAAVSGIDLHGYYVNSNGSNSAKEDSEKVTSFAGIEYFTELLMFNCSHNLLTELNISGCTALYGLYCSNNRLTSLDVSKSTALIRLTCGSNQLSSLDVSDCVGLIDLSCVNNRLTSLDVSNCVELIELNCGGNELTSLDISKCTALAYLICAGNPGDGVSKLPVRAWFDNNSIPNDFDPTISTWNFNTTIISIDFQKVN